LNDIVGAADMLAGKATQLSGVKVLDNYTLQVTIDAPKAYFLDKMAYPTAFVVDRANVASGGEWWRHPNGTGPFRLKQWQVDQLVVLERNPTYYGEKALLSEVDFQLFGGNPIQSYQEGKIDVSFVGSAYMGLVTDPTNAVAKELQMYPELSLSYIGFNATVPPFDDAKVRQAFSYAIDKERLTALTVQNTVATAYGILPPGMPGYSASLKGLRFDPQMAKQLIAASKYGDVSKLPPLVLTTAGWGNDISSILGGVIDDWRRNLGVEVTVRQLEPENFLYALSQEKDNLFDNGWIADYPDPQDFLDVLFRTGSQNNTGGYSNPQLDALLNKAAIEQDPAARLQMYQQAEQIIVQDAAMLPLFFGRSYVLVKPYVKNYSLSPLGYPMLSKISIQK
jgi:oligopeptide transport system substrate-binding protein